MAQRPLAVPCWVHLLDCLIDLRRRCRPWYEPVALPFPFILVWRAVELLGTRRLSGFDKGVEILVLRHQLEVLQRKAPGHASRGQTGRSWPWRRACLACAGPRRWWRRPPCSSGSAGLSEGAGLGNRPGRPPLPQETVELTCRLAPL